MQGYKDASKADGVPTLAATWQSSDKTNYTSLYGEICSDRRRRGLAHEATRRQAFRETNTRVGAAPAVPYKLWPYMGMALYSYGPIWLWPCIVMSRPAVLYSCGPT